MKPKVLIVLIVISVTLILSGCRSSDDENPTPNNPQSESTYQLIEQNIFTDAPCRVNIMFQVIAQDGLGVSGLSTGNFEVQEDRAPVSVRESDMRIEPHNTVPYHLKSVLVIDNSRSVELQLESIKSAAISMVQSISSNQLFSIWVFSDSISMLQDFTNNVSALTAAINAIGVGAPTTNLYGAVMEGLQTWSDHANAEDIEQGYMILITDGRDTRGTHDLNEVLQERQNKMIYAIGISSEDLDPSVLQTLSSTGKYISVANAGQVAAELANIQTRMVRYANSFYWLHYLSPTREDRQHTLLVRIRGQASMTPPHAIVGEFNSREFYSINPGVYVSPNPVVGITGSTMRLRADTYYANNPPNYVWTSLNPSVVQLSVDGQNSAFCNVEFLGHLGDTASIRVADTSNSNITDVAVLINSFQFQMLNTAISYTDGNQYYTYHGILKSAINQILEVSLELIDPPYSSQCFSFRNYDGEGTSALPIYRQTQYHVSQIDSLVDVVVCPTTFYYYNCEFQPIWGDYSFSITVHSNIQNAIPMTYNLRLDDTRQ